MHIGSKYYNTSDVPDLFNDDTSRRNAGNDEFQDIVYYIQMEFQEMLSPAGNLHGYEVD